MSAKSGKPARTAGLLLAFLAAGLLQAGAAYTEAQALGQNETLLTAKNSPGATVGETSLGDAAADAVLAVSGADLVILNGGDFHANLQGGAVTWGALLAVFPEEKALAVRGVTPAQLNALLEAGFSHIALDGAEAIDEAASAYGGFPQIAGFSVIYDASAPPGGRVYTVTLPDGTELDMGAEAPLLSLCATAETFGGAYGLPALEGAKDLGLTLPEALAAYLAENGGIGEPEMGRVTAIGTTSRRLIGPVPGGVFLIALAAILAFLGTTKLAAGFFERKK